MLTRRLGRAVMIEDLKGLWNLIALDMVQADLIVYNMLYRYQHNWEPLPINYAKSMAKIAYLIYPPPPVIPKTETHSERELRWRRILAYCENRKTLKMGLDTTNRYIFSQK